MSAAVSPGMPPGRAPLPALLVLTDGQATGGRRLSEVIAAAVRGGARAVLLREKHLDREQRLALAQELAALLAPVDGLLLMASDPTIRAAGVHLAARDPFPATHVPAIPKGAGPGAGAGIVGRSCHTPSEVVSAAAEGCHYATLSPVFLSASKPGYGPALGPVALADLALPTWALGGVDAGNARSCIEGGAAGVAVMGEIMRAPDPEGVVASLLAALGG